MVPPSALNLSGGMPAAVMMPSTRTVVAHPRSPGTIRLPLRSAKVLIGLSFSTNSAMTTGRPRF